MNTYERVTQYVQHLDAYPGKQPSLSHLAYQMGFNESQLHRLIASWGNIRPNIFFNNLHSSYIKTLLNESEAAQKTTPTVESLNNACSQKLCVTLETASNVGHPSTIPNWPIVFGFAETPFGQSIIAENPRGICYLAFVDQNTTTSTYELQQCWSHSKIQQSDRIAANWVDRIFRHQSAHQKSKIDVYAMGTRFQVRVWNALLNIPPKSLTTYGRLASAIGQPNAARAVGSAVGKNPISYLIPCHRVVRETGAIGGYRWGLLRKRILIAWESAL